MSLSVAHRARLTAKKLTETEFTELVAEIVKASIPNADVTVVGPLELSITTEAGSGRQFLENAWSACKKRASDRPSIVLQHVRSVRESLTGMNALPSRESIIPMVKDEAWVRAANEQAAVGCNVTAERIAADIWIVYAVDRPDSVAYLTDSERVALGLSLDEIRPLALHNLRRVLPEVELHELPGEGPPRGRRNRAWSATYMLTAGGNFEASLLVVDEVWDRQQNLVSGDLVAVVPARDLILFTGAASKEGVERLRDVLDRDFNHRISNTLLIRTNKRWEPFDA